MRYLLAPIILAILFITDHATALLLLAYFLWATTLLKRPGTVDSTTSQRKDPPHVR